jgi:hypothetical protein
MATVVTRTPLNVTLYVHWLSCLLLKYSFCLKYVRHYTSKFPSGHWLMNNKTVSYIFVGDCLYLRKSFVISSSNTSLVIDVKVKAIHKCYAAAMLLFTSCNKKAVALPCYYVTRYCISRVVTGECWAGHQWRNVQTIFRERQFILKGSQK